MKRKCKANHKPIPAALKKKAVGSPYTQHTETSAEHLTAKQYTETKSSAVPSEASASEVVNGFLQKWSHWIAWIGVVGAVIFTYSIFNNDVYVICPMIMSIIGDDSSIEVICLDLHKKNVTVKSSITNSNKNILI